MQLQQWWHLYCFAILGSTSIVIHSVKQRLSDIGPEVTLRPLATSCAKDYKGHSLVQTSFTEPPNSKGWLCHRRPTGGGYLPHTWRLPPSLMWKPDATSKQQHVGGLWLEAELVRHRKTVTTQPFQLENLISTLSTRKALKVKASENLSLVPGAGRKN